MSARDSSFSIRMLLGGALTAFGVALALDALDIMEVDRISRFWPVLLIVIGVALLARARHGGAWFPGAILTLIGTGFLLEELGYLRYGFDAIWPLIIILVGLAIMSRGFRPRKREVEAVPEDAIRTYAMLCSSNPASSSKAFRGGDASTFLGSVEIDLSQADIGDEPAVLDVFALMGGIEIRVPRDWTVDSRVTPFMGGMEDSTDRSRNDPTKRLVVQGFVMMGGISIKN